MKFFKNHKLLISILLIGAFLRLYKIDQVPVSLFGDELDVGYHAYSILKTGRDYSGNFMPLHFQSLAEWRTPLYLYSSVPTVAVFGISPYGVRLPAVIFGVFGVWLIYLLSKEVFKSLEIRNSKLEILAAFLLAISPWHIQYSRAGFEVTQMLALFLAGVYFFLKGLKAPKLLWLAGVFLALTPYSYSTAKLFLPLTVLALFLIWKKEILQIPKKYLVWTTVSFFLIVTPITLSTVFGGGTARFNYISVFSDPTTVPEIGFARLEAARVRDPNVTFGIQPSILDRIMHNKIIWWSGVIGRNYLQSFSTQFLFINGDLNPRHSPQNIGQFYKIEAFFLLAGLVFFFIKPFDKKIKIFILVWLLIAPLPAALTRDGGMHATRLFFFLPPLIFLTATGIYYMFETLSKQWRKLGVVSIASVYLISVWFYQYDYYVHYPWQSERWWHAGFREAIQSIKQIDKDYDKVFISTASEPPWIFFAGWYEYPPDKWQKGYPFQKTDVPGFGQISYIDKFYFGSPTSVYGLGEYIDEKALYLSTAKEVGTNLILEKNKGVAGLNLIKAIAYPSGEPIFYLFEGIKKE